MFCKACQSENQRTLNGEIAIRFPGLAGVVRLHFVLVLFSLLGVVSCGGVSSNPETPVTTTQPTFAHVVLVVLENHSYSEVIGNSAMPYLNGLAQQNGLAAQYYATHTHRYRITSC